MHQSVATTVPRVVVSACVSLYACLLVSVCVFRAFLLMHNLLPASVQNVQCASIDAGTYEQGHSTNTRLVTIASIHSLVYKSTACRKPKVIDLSNYLRNVTVKLGCKL